MSRAKNELRAVMMSNGNLRQRIMYEFSTQVRGTMSCRIIHFPGVYTNSYRDECTRDLFCPVIFKEYIHEYR